MNKQRSIIATVVSMTIALAAPYVVSAGVLDAEAGGPKQQERAERDMARDRERVAREQADREQVAREREYAAMVQAESEKATKAHSETRTLYGHSSEFPIEVPTQEISVRLDTNMSVNRDNNPARSRFGREGEGIHDREDRGHSKPNTKQTKASPPGPTVLESRPPLVDAKREDEYMIQIALIVKPPFTSTPLGQTLYPSQSTSDVVNATPTKNSRAGGYPGRLRSGGTKHHWGLDDPSADPVRDITRYMGTGIGKVVEARDAYNVREDNTREYLGKLVKIQFETEEGVWTSTTLHHRQILVERGDMVIPGQPIARGAGAGDQFNSDKAGKPHVHWELRLNGNIVNPLSGEVIKFVPKKDRPKARTT